MSAGDADALQDRLGELRERSRPSPLHTLYASPGVPRSSERKIGVDHVVDVQEVAHRVAVADRQRAAAPRGAPARAPRATAAGSSRGLPGARVVEASRADDADALAAVRLQRGDLLRRLRRGVERQRPLRRRPRRAASRSASWRPYCSADADDEHDGIAASGCAAAARPRRAGARRRRCSPRSASPDRAPRRARG